MAYIAAAAGFPTPTVFNSFGSKDGILIALITEGTAVTRESDRALHSRDGADLAELITGLSVRVSFHAPEIAGKRAWRYAEAAAIRHPDVDLSLQFAIVARGATLLPGRVDPHQHLLSAAYGQVRLQLADIRGVPWLRRDASRRLRLCRRETANQASVLGGPLGVLV